MVKGATRHNSDTSTTQCYTTTLVATPQYRPSGKGGQAGRHIRATISEKPAVTVHFIHFIVRDTCPGSLAQLGCPIERNQPVSYQTTSRQPRSPLWNRVCVTQTHTHAHICTHTRTHTHTNTHTKGAVAYT